MENIKKNPLSLQLNAEDFLPASNEEKQSLVVMRESVNFWKDGIRRLKKNKIAMVSFVFIIAIAIFAYLLPAVWPYSYSEQMKGKDAEIEKIKSDYAFDAAVKEAIRKASGKNERAIMALLDVDGLKASKNQTQDIDAALAAVKKDNDYLFGSSAPVPRVVSSTSGINNDAQTKREQANEALRNLFGKGE